MRNRSVNPDSVVENNPKPQKTEEELSSWLDSIYSEVKTKSLIKV